MNKDHYSRFPHEFSGGQRQRIGIARALAVNPEFIICDEPVSALDVSIRAQIINLLKKLKNDMDLTYIFISHDLNLVRYVSDRVVVMYLGSIVEQTGADKLYKKQYHPYTKALISSAPIADPKKQREKIFISLKGEIKSPINTPECCKFVDRCSKKMDVCYKKRPNLIEIEKNHFVACHLYN